jgi:N-acyl-D-aspartate/D-glutamate deacylase
MDGWVRPEGDEVLDVAIVGGLVVDGTGATRRRADVGIRSGSIVAIGRLDEAAHRTIDAGDMIVGPGFIDLHTHYDAQALWDPTLGPSPLHGVTTAIAGNCGFSIAPLTDRTASYVPEMLSRVEGMPLASLRAAADWSWRSTADYLERIPPTSIGLGVLVGHSALRGAVMGLDFERAAAPAEIAAMATLLRAGLAAGGLGFSSSWGTSHRDPDGRPAPSRFASHDELVALAAVCGEFAGTSLQFIPPNMNEPFDDEVLEVMTTMSAAARRPINWNVMIPEPSNLDACRHNLRVAAEAGGRGARVVALTAPFPALTRLTFDTGFVLDVLPGWEELFAMARDERCRVLADPQRRGELEQRAREPSPVRRFFDDWGDMHLFDTHTPATRRWAGRSVADVAAATGASAFDALIDVVCADGLLTGFGRLPTRAAETTMRARAEIWADPGTVLGGSDAGAHLDMLDGFALTTRFLQGAVREHGLLSTEAAVHHLTAAPAALYGLHDRGRLVEGARADVVVFDEETVAPRPCEVRTDLPDGSARLFGAAVGISHVLVGGEVVCERGEMTDARPGILLRSGRDTLTPSMAAVREVDG